jgi:hypothetical protein
LTNSLPTHKVVDAFDGDNYHEKSNGVAYGKRTAFHESRCQISRHQKVANSGSVAKKIILGSNNLVSQKRKETE